MDCEGSSLSEGEQDSAAARRAEIYLRLDHERDHPDLLDLYIEAQCSFERGDNRQSARLLDRLLAGSPSSELAELSRSLRRRIGLHRPTLMVAVACFILLLLIWYLSAQA